MLRSEGAVIPMQPQVNKEACFLTGDSDSLKNINDLPALPIFSEQVVDFLNTLSVLIFSDQKCKQYSDVLTFGFWCRRALLVKLKERYQDGYFYLGRGVVFHVSPSNLPIIFAYSLVTGLLAGNANIVRVPSK